LGMDSPLKDLATSPDLSPLGRGLRMTGCECPVILKAVKNLVWGAHALNIESQQKVLASCPAPRTLRRWTGLRVTDSPRLARRRVLEAETGDRHQHRLVFGD
jgi:hypothetical protein